MKILVTGGTGFTGKALVKRLLNEGHQVTALDRKEGLDTHELREWGADLVLGSVVDRGVLDRCIREIDVVHHLAAAFRELDVPESFYDEVNVQGTRNVLEAAARHGVKKFIYCSTCGVHGNVDNPPADETAPIKPADYYQQTKYNAEPIVREYFTNAMKTVTLRPAAIYGPGDPERFYMIFRQVARGSFPMFGAGTTLYHPLYIDNLVDALMLAQEPGKGDGETYLIADAEYLSIEDLVRRVAQALGVSVRIRHYPLTPLVLLGHTLETVCKPFRITPPLFPRRVDWFRQNRAFDISKARLHLGYDPQVALDEGLKRTAQWYREKGYL